MSEERLELLFWFALLTFAALLFWKLPMVQFIGFPVYFREDGKVMDDNNWPKAVAWIVSMAICVALLLMFLR